MHVAGGTNRVPTALDTMKRPTRLTILVLGILLGALALVGVLTLTRGTPVQIVVAEGPGAPPAIVDPLFERTLELYTGTHISLGNRVEQLLNGSVYDRLWVDLRSARSTITVQMYYSIPGRVADTMAAILRERSQAGVRVLLVLDAFGSQNLGEKWRDDLRAAGVEVAQLRKLRWYSIHNASDRSHARVVVVDGRIGYTGGFGLADYWLGSGRRENEWRESSVRFEGPAVMQLQGAFAAAWAEATGELLAGGLFFPPGGFDEKGDVHAGLLFTAPTHGSTPAERFLVLTLAGARQRLYIANSYFVPDDDLRRLLKAARRRGVDVRILTVSNKTDIKTTWYAGRYRYEELLKAGIRIYEYQPTMMHAKTIVADGLFVTIGSMNFDNRSLAFNNETNLVAFDAGLAREMEQTFLADLAYSTEITLPAFSKRPRWNRVLEAIAATMSRLL